MFAIVFIIYRTKNILEDREEETGQLWQWSKRYRWRDGGWLPWQWIWEEERRKGSNRQRGEHHLAWASRSESQLRDSVSTVNIGREEKKQKVNVTCAFSIFLDLASWGFSDLKDEEEANDLPITDSPAQADPSLSREDLVTGAQHPSSAPREGQALRMMAPGQQPMLKNKGKKACNWSCRMEQIFCTDKHVHRVWCYV